MSVGGSDPSEAARAGQGGAATAIHRRVARLRAGDDPTMIARLGTGWAVLGEAQVVRGYCLLLPDPVVPQLNDLDADNRARFLLEMTLLGDAVLRVVQATRINYEILGNLEPALHAHVVPRRQDEAEALRTRPIWFYDWDAAPRFDPQRDAALQAEIRSELERVQRHPR